MKKSVKWKNKASEKTSDEPNVSTTPISSSGPVSKARTISLYELNKKYDELRLKYPDREPKVLLPLLVSANRREPATNLLGSRQNSELIADEHRRKIDACKKTFLTLVDSENSGFYSYKDSNGSFN